MRKLTRTGALLLGLVLGGCAANSGVVSTGSGAYKVSRHASNGYSHPGMLRADAEHEAEEYCVNQHQVAVIFSVQESPPPFIFGNYPTAEVRFFCRDSNEMAAVSQPPAASQQPAQ
jgi:hypothetical protein